MSGAGFDARQKALFSAVTVMQRSGLCLSSWSFTQPTFDINHE